jgi:hypothetical protein
MPGPVVAGPVAATAVAASTVVASTVVASTMVASTAVASTVISHPAGHGPVLAGAPGVRPASRPADAGWGWLRRAAEMAALAGGLPLALPLSGQASASGRERPCYPRIAMRTASLEPGSISAARKFTALIMQRWGAADRGADASVVVSELLSNAVRHGLPPAAAPAPEAAGAAAPARPDRRAVRLGLLHSGSCILCAVTDPSDQPPVPRIPDGLDEGGRGLHVIAALSDYWGSCPGAPGEAGKVVWATFLTAP